MVPQFKDYKPYYIVNGHKWTLVFKNRLKKGLFGLCDPDIKTIFVSIQHPLFSRRMALPEVYATVIHEMLHAFEFEYEIELGERLVTKLEHAITDFLVSNK